MGSISKKLYLKRTRLIGDEILKLIDNGDRSLLDFGCASMTLSRYIASKSKIDVHGIDLFDCKTEDVKYTKYDGGKLPFDDNHFDVVMAIFVLHHTDDPEFYLKELIRVSKKKIILCEDTYANKIGKMLTKVFDWIFNVPYGSDVGNNFKSIQGWKDLFRKNKVTLMKLEKIYPHPIPFIPTTNVIIELKK